MAMGTRKQGESQEGMWVARAALPTSPGHPFYQRLQQEVFQWVLRVVAEKGLLKGQTVAIDATTLEANAALRSIVRRDSGEGYQEFLQRLAKESGMATPTREDLARLDRKRRHKGSNDEWEHPHDPEAHITKMKDGGTHLAHKVKQAVDLGSGAVVAVTIQGADQGDTATVMETLAEAGLVIAEVVLDKGYHSNETLVANALFFAIGVLAYNLSLVPA